VTTTTTNPEYRAQTDAATAAWHLGTADREARCVCGVKLMTPDDTRAFALKVPAAERGYQTDPDVSKVTCGSCKRNREYLMAAAAGTCSTEPLKDEAARPSRRRAPRSQRNSLAAGAGLNASKADR
jgi:hypothetical protein